MKPLVPGTVVPTQFRNNVCSYDTRGTSNGITLSILAKNDFRLAAALALPTSVRVSGLGDLAVYDFDIPGYATLWVVKGDVAVAIGAHGVTGVSLDSLRPLAVKVLSRI